MMREVSHVQAAQCILVLNIYFEFEKIGNLSQKYRKK